MTLYIHLLNLYKHTSSLYIYTKTISNSYQYTIIITILIIVPKSKYKTDPSLLLTIAVLSFLSVRIVWHMRTDKKKKRGGEDHESKYAAQRRKNDKIGLFVLFALFRLLVKENMHILYCY